MAFGMPRASASAALSFCSTLGRRALLGAAGAAGRGGNRCCSYNAKMEFERIVEFDQGSAGETLQRRIQRWACAFESTARPPLAAGKQHLEWGPFGVAKIGTTGTTPRSATSRRAGPVVAATTAGRRIFATAVAGSRSTPARSHRVQHLRCSLQTADGDGRLTLFGMRPRCDVSVDKPRLLHTQSYPCSNIVQ